MNGRSSVFIDERSLAYGTCTSDGQPETRGFRYLNACAGLVVLWKAG